ncbi:MAG TPA: hypothetical protein VK213_13320 [Bacteroidales bacterium]|nr:hypothetical protein [Bacteroidales bacterium]
MDFRFSPVVSHSDIDVDDIDPYEDAWGLNAEFTDVIEVLCTLSPSPGDTLTENLIQKVKKLD